MPLLAPITKVAILMGTLGGGGAERVMLNFANGLSRRNIRVDLVIGHYQGPFTTLKYPEVRVVELGHGMLRSVPRIRSYLKEASPQVLFASQSHVNAAAILATRFLKNRPLVLLREATTPSMAYEFTSSRWIRSYLWLCRRLVQRADHLIATSQDAARDCESYYRLSKERVSHLYSPLISDELFTLAAEPLVHQFDQSVPTIVTVGRVMPVKDFETLLRAFAVVRHQRLCKLIVVGDTTRDPSYMILLRSLMVELSIAEDVEFVGFHTNPFPFLAQADTFVLSSRYEGLPGSLVQAMALGCKLVSTNCPSGPREVLDNGKRGRLVPVGDYAAMGGALIESLSATHDRGLGRRWAEEFTEESAIDRLLQLIGNLVKNPLSLSG